VAASQHRNLTPIIIGIAAVLAVAGALLLIERRGGRSPLEITFANSTPGPIQVYVTGAVAEPGVYEMMEGDRVVDLLYKAGGNAPEADLQAINLSKRLQDEDMVVVPRQGEASTAGATSQVLGASTPININTATLDDLDTLPGIGAVYSQRIVDSRTRDGPFTTTEELVLRSLMPQSTYEKIRDLITAGP